MDWCFQHSQWMHLRFSILHKNTLTHAQKNRCINHPICRWTALPAHPWMPQTLPIILKECSGMWSFDPSMNSSLTFTRPLCCCLCLFLCVCVCVHIPWRAHTWKHTYALGSISLDGWIAEIEKKNHASCCRAQQVFRNVGCSLITMFFSFFSFLAVVNYFPNYNHYANEKLELKLSLCWCLIVSRQEQW